MRCWFRIAQEVAEGTEGQGLGRIAQEVAEETEGAGLG